MQAVINHLRNFLQYVAVNLIDEPKHAQLKVTELGPDRLRFKLVLTKKDVAMLIGRNGFTASAIRGLLKAAAQARGIQALLQIHSHEDEIALMAREDAEMQQQKIPR
ncbi:MAG: KH domain-containing protein [Akkermansiaceae bacterium]|nr:KH domain-containing protein [Akkermansiaceae bacterium]